MMARPGYKLLAIALSVSLFIGCGYTLRKSIESVRLMEIKNRTFEPRLSDRMTEALAYALNKKGIHVSGSSGYELSGTIDELSIRTDSVSNDVATSYRVLLSCTFTLKTPSGEKRVLQRGNDFITSFSSVGAMEYVAAYKDLAVQKALADLADSLVAQLTDDIK